MRTDLIDTVIAAFHGNPFEVSARDRGAAFEAIAEMDIGATISRLLRTESNELAKQMILAVGHAQACVETDPSRVLDSGALPPSVLRKLPRKRGEYLRICMAAGRCFRVLAEVRGTSDLVEKARGRTWAACFGSSLREMLDLEQVIHDHDVLLLGETGTGKEHFARAMMAGAPGDQSGNPAPNSAINAAAIPETLVESELFGHEKGSFTGATETRSGRLRSADGGTFFLDEVGDLPKTTQVKLLRVIETNEVHPVGSDSSHSVSVRYIAATHKDLQALTDAGDFRRDLFERLAGNIIHIPPLRDRPEDILEIGRAFVRRYLNDKDHPVRLSSIEEWLGSSEARSYRWPGNVRELQNALRNMILGLPPGLKSSGLSAPVVGSRSASDVPEPIANSTATLEAVEDWYIHRVLDANEGNYSQSARVLGIDRSTVKRRTSGS